MLWVYLHQLVSFIVNRLGSSTMLLCVYRGHSIHRCCAMHQQLHYMCTDKLSTLCMHCHCALAIIQQQLTILLHAPRGVRFEDNSSLLYMVPQSAMKPASAAQKEQGVRSPLLGQYFKCKFDDSTGDIQVIHLLLCTTFCK
jgi:hypothetical protein